MSESPNLSSPDDAITAGPAAQPEGRQLATYDEAVAALDPHGPTLQQISDDYERYFDTHNDASGPRQTWQEFFVEDLDIRRAYGTLVDSDAHLNLDCLDPATGRPRTEQFDDAGQDRSEVDEQGADEDGWI